VYKMKGRAAVPLILTILAVYLALPVGAFAQASVPEGAASYPEGLVHTVVEGDTLWDLAAKHLGSPWKWPELWERNRFFTNPHYIYPGIRIVIFPPPPKEYVLPASETPPADSAASAEAPAPVAAEVAKPSAPPAVPKAPTLDISPSDFVRAGEFLKEMPKGIGRIRAAEEPKVAFSEGDRVFLKLDKEIPAGQLLGVYRVRGPITAPAGRPVTGYARYLVGLVQVKGKGNGETFGVVRKSFEDLSRQDQLSEEIPSYAPVPLSPGAAGLEATVISGQWENEELATGNFVFLNRGAGAGVAVGNVFRLVEDGGKAAGALSGREPGIQVDVGQAVVVRVSQEFSTAYIVKSYLSFPAGVTAIRGAEAAR
jgi:hypothetical protein